MYERLSVWVYECMCVWMYVCMSVCVYECMCVWVYVCMSICVYECMSVHACVYEYMSVCVYECMCVWVYEYMSVRVYVCMSVWVCELGLLQVQDMYECIGYQLHGHMCCVCLFPTSTIQVSTIKHNRALLEDLVSVVKQEIDVFLDFTIRNCPHRNWPILGNKSPHKVSKIP